MFDFPASPANGQIFQPSGGPAWQFDGTAWKTLVTASGFRGPTRTVIPTLGSSTYTLPAGCTSIEVEVVGGGGCGGGTTGSSAAGQGVSGGGGGGGGYAKKLIQVTDAVRAATKTIFVAAGGTGGGAGGTSSYTDGVNTVQGFGGQPGANGVFSANNVYRYGGAGGSGSGGDLNRPGSPGRMGYSTGSLDLGSTNAAAWGGDGGDSVYGAGGQGTLSGGAASGASSGTGNAAVSVGGGGGGGYCINGVAGNVAGGAGYQGIVMITEYYTGDPTPRMLTAETRNRIVNGAMQISQEQSSTAVDGGYPVDQWQLGVVSSSTITVQRNTSPTGVAQPNAVGITPSPAETSAAAGEIIYFYQRIEGIRLNDFALGSASSKAFVIAFDIYATVAGTYWVSLCSASAAHTYLVSYTIAAGELNGWVRKSVAVPAGAINAGTWPVGNAMCAFLRFAFHCGTTYTGVAGMQAGNFIAGPGQALGMSAGGVNLSNAGLYLDPGNTGIAPPWQMPDEAQELAACMRYWQSRQYVVDTASLGQSIMLGAAMRTNPSVTGGGAGFVVNQNNNGLSLWATQTTRALQALTFNARM